MGRNRPRSRAVDVTKSLLVPTGVADYIPVQVAPSQVVQVTEDELSPTQGSMNAAALRREGKLDAFVKLCTNWRNGSCHNHAACSFGHVLRYFNTGTPESKGSAENTNSNDGGGGGGEVYTMSGGLSEEAAVAAAAAGGMLMMPGAVSEANKAAMHRAGSTHSLSHTQSGNGLSWLQRLVPGSADPTSLVGHGQSNEVPCAPHAVCRTPSNAERHGVPSMKSVSELEVRSGDSFFGSNANLLGSMNNNTSNITTMSGNNSASHSRYLGITPRTSRTMEEEMRSGEDMGRQQGRTEASLTRAGGAAPSFTVYGPSTSARTNASTSTSNTTTNNSNHTASLMMNGGPRYGGHLSQHAPMNGTIASHSLHHNHHHGGSTSPAMAGLERTRSTGRMSDVYVDWNHISHSHSPATGVTAMSPTSSNPTATTAAAAQSVWWGSAAAAAAAAASAMNNGYPASPPSRRYTAPSSTTLSAAAVPKPDLPFLDPALVHGAYENSHGAAVVTAANGVPHQQMASAAGRSNERVQPSVVFAGRQKGSGQGTLEDWAAHGAWLDAADDRRRHGTASAQGTHAGPGALGVNVGGAETWGVKSAHSPLHACPASEGGTASGINWAEGLKATTAAAAASPVVHTTTMAGSGNKANEAERQACYSVPGGHGSCAVVAAPRVGGVAEGGCATQTELAATEQTEEPPRMPSKASLQHLMQLLTQGT